MLYHAKAGLHSFTFSSILNQNVRYGNATPLSVETMILLLSSSFKRTLYYKMVLFIMWLNIE